MSGLSDISAPVQPLRAGSGAVEIESPLPASPVGGRPRQDPRAARQVLPISDDGQPSGTAASPGRETGSGQADRPRRSGQAAGPALAVGGALRPPLSSAGFAAQLLGQDDDVGPEGRGSVSELEHHRVSNAYRRSGGEPPLFPESAAVFSLAV